MDSPTINTFFDRAEALHFAQEVIAPAKEIRIATAFFELSGYALLESALSGKKWKLLVGNEENNRDKVRFFLEEFIHSLAELAPAEKIPLLQRFRLALKAGSVAFRIGRPGKAEALKAAYISHHAKLYIADKSACLVTSANFTRNGLTQSREAGYVVRDAAEVEFYVKKFDEFFEEAEPITDEFLQVVDDLLQFRHPYEVYARSLLELYGLPEETVAGPLQQLVAFQRPLVAGLLQTIRDYGGAMLVASTGLGKTVMAAHVAAQLRHDGLISRVLIFAPAGLRDMWSRAMRAANVSSREFSYQILSLDDWQRYRMVQNLDEELRYVAATTLVILDESHHLRNAFVTEADKVLRLRNERIKKAVAAGGRVLLMTATPYSRGVDDVNNQLRLLPLREVEEMGGMAQRAWKVERPAELSQIPVCSVMTAPTVVSRFSEGDAYGNRFILFENNSRRYFPSALRLNAVEYENPLNGALKRLLQSDLLRKKNDTQSTDTLFSAEEGVNTARGRRDPLFESRLVHQFCSSVAEALETLKKMGEAGGYERLRFERQAELTELTRALITELTPLLNTADLKYAALHRILTDHPDEKTVIFCIYRKTALYLAERIQADFPKRRTATTVERESDDLEQLLGLFAPVANGLTDPESADSYAAKLKEHEINVLVATEAVSEGFNLQDAAILVNYDLPWTILSLAQRMGRILRPWHTPRSVSIWNFIPDTMQKQEFRTADAWRGRLERRSADYSSFARLPVLLRNEREEVQLYSVAEALSGAPERDISLADTLAFIESAEGIHTSTVFDDLAQVDAESAARIRRIRGGFRSVLIVSPAHSGFYLLIKAGSRHFCGYFSDSGSLRLESEKQIEILSIIRCSANLKPPAENPDLIAYERIERAAFDNLVKYLNRSVGDCQIVCSMLCVSA